jgi:hypothetical protein
MLMPLIRPRGENCSEFFRIPDLFSKTESAGQNFFGISRKRNRKRKYFLETESNMIIAVPSELGIGRKNSGKFVGISEVKKAHPNSP